MAKRSAEKNGCKSLNSKKICDNKSISIADDNLLRNYDNCERKSNKIGIIKSESSPLLSEQRNNFCDFYENNEEKIGKSHKKCVKIEDSRVCTSLKLSHFVIVDSVLKETNINPAVEAILPISLNNIYRKFINSGKYLQQWQAKDEFYRGVGLFGIGVEERIYSKRKALEDSLKRGFRLRPNPKPRRQFDGTIINRQLKNSYKSKDDKVKYNIFTIGNHLMKKRPQIRKAAMKKKSVVRRAAAQKLQQAKKALNEVYNTSEEDEAERDAERSIALSRAKRQTKVPQLDFKYCYNDAAFGVRARKFAEQGGKEDQFMEIIDSDSSSVVEVFPQTTTTTTMTTTATLHGDKENSEYSNHDLNNSKFVIGARKGWRPRGENKALNLLDKLRLGLQCTVIQTEQDVIIQHLTLEDLSTLRSRLQGLTTFKNIEAEYDKNGLETARATIDRRVLNLPFKGCEGQTELAARVAAAAAAALKRGDSDTNNNNLKRKIVEKKMLAAIPRDCKSVEDVCPTWVRPKVRSVKKIRKLYTQSANTPNILARSQSIANSNNNNNNNNNNSNNSNSRTTVAEIVSNSNRQKCQSSTVSDVSSNTPPVSFYPQITSSNILTEPIVDSKTVKSEPSCISSSETTTVIDTTVTSTPVLTFVTASHGSGSTDSGSKRISNGTPATAMSASQLLMLRKGGSGGGLGAVSGQSTSSSELATACTTSTSLSMTRNDQLFANQILKPFKKTIPASSPSKLEIDDEDTEFELTPSIIEQAKTVDTNVTLSSSPVSVQNRVPFISKPLIQPAGVLTSCRRTIHLSHTSNSSPISTNRLVTCNKLPISDSSSSCSSSSFIVLPTVPNSINLDTTVTTSSSYNINSKVDQPLTNSNLKIKHRKWTHNFLTSNSINFREVLCAATQRNIPAVQKPLTVTTVTPLSPKPLAVPSVIVSNITQTFKYSDRASTASVPPAKGSSVVLKSLLVGSNTANDLCNVNKSAVWTSKYLATNSNGQDSKIKWQVGGSVVPSLPVSVATVSKDNLVNSNNSNNSNNNNNSSSDNK